MAKILLADDEVNLRTAIREFAEFQGYQVVEAGDGIEALNLCKTQDFDIIIMDVMMPRLDGFTAYQEIKKIRDIPVLILSSKDQEYDKLYGFQLGIDDYVVKPFSLKELMARVNVIISRHQSAAAPQPGGEEVLRFDGLELNLPARRVLVDGQRVELRPKEYDLLFFLAQNRNRVFSREALLERVWGYDYVGDDRTVDAHIKMLRHDLGEYRRFLVTLRGAGYKFETD